MNWNYNQWGNPQMPWGPPNMMPQQSGVVYVPIPNPAKETDDPYTTFLKHKEMGERIEKLFKKDDGDKKKEAKGLSVKDMCWLMAVLAIPVGLSYAGLFFLVVRGLRTL